MTRQPHVRPVTPAARYQWRETHPQEPRWHDLLGLAGVVLCGVALLLLAVR